MAVKTPERAVSEDLIAEALAKTVAQGDIVNFRFLFFPFSPARRTSNQRFDDAVYSHLIPDEALRSEPAFREALQLAREPGTWKHILGELEAARPAQLPSSLLLALADNAVRMGQYTNAAQAYELIRIRSRMQETFYKAGDDALREGKIDRGVQGYLIATGLDYDYAAFPEPLPSVPNFQTQALLLHADYPAKPEDAVALQETDRFLRIALAYLLLSPEAAARLEDLSRETKVAFLVTLIKRRDPKWIEFAQRYQEAVQMMKDVEERRKRDAGDGDRRALRLAEELAAQYREAAGQIPAKLLGREIPGGSWWQYLKDIAYQHPAAPLFVSRQLVGDREIVVPRRRTDSPVPKAAGLVST